jgi:hypothetical protein
LALYETVAVFPCFTRVGDAVIWAVAPVQESWTLSEQDPPEPLQDSVYAPDVVTLLVPEVAPPVENPPPVQLVARVEDQVSVDGTVVAGLADRLQVGGGGGGGAATATAVHTPQLSPSSDSEMSPGSPEELLSAHARRYQVPADGKVYPKDAVPEEPEASAARRCVPMSVALAPPALVARWKRVVKPRPVLALPVLVTIALKTFESPAVAEVGDTAPAVRSGAGAAATAIAVHGPQLSFSSSSEMSPVSPAEVLSAQARTYQVPADGKVYT